MLISEVMNPFSKRNESASSAPMEMKNDDNLFFIVHSHLRWDFVWQRPQQILSRLAMRYPVLFVEEPLYQDGASYLETQECSVGVVRIIPRLSMSLRDNGDQSLEMVRNLLRAFIARSKDGGTAYGSPIQWFYTPMPAPVMLGHFDEIGVVYDCMDELSKFRFAPTDICAREEILIQAADVVFTGGYKLGQAKARIHDNVHFFGCGVDADHFQKAHQPDTCVAEDIAALPKPVLGFYGVIDERLDYDLIAKLAATRPDCSVAMIGPVVKVDPAELPRAANIHWLGQKDFNELPAYVKAFDVCLMPFALNESTEYINPTKTLEYMAAGKPIVSTAVEDVINNFLPIVAVADNHKEFIDAVGNALEHPDKALLARGLVRAKEATWTAIVEQMAGLILQALGERDGADLMSRKRDSAVM